MKNVRDDLAASLANDLNKQTKGTNVAFFLDGSGEAPTDVKEFISTGSSMLDLAIANRPNGGIPVGRITEITGMEAAGKSLVAAHILAETQKKGGLAVYIDTESAASTDFLEAIGVNISNLLYVQMESLEDIFETMEDIIVKIRESSKDRLVTIVVDSVAGASTQNEIEGNYDKEGWATDKALIISKAMRKITNMIARQRICLVFTNQLRMKLGVSFGDPYTTSGGKALQFHSSVRLRLKKTGQIKVGSGTTASVIGISTKAQVTMNRCGPPLRHADFDIYFDSGIDDFGGWLKVLKNHKLIKQAGAWYNLDMVDEKTGEVLLEKKFQSKDFNKIMEDDKLRNHLYGVICEAAIMKYKPKTEVGIDDVVIEEESAEVLSDEK